MKVIINGAGGHMGQYVRSVVEAKDGMEVAALVDKNGDYIHNLADFTGEADVIIDFTHHSATDELIDYAVSRKIPVIVATTGQTDEERAKIIAAGKEIPVFFSANMSLGVALLVNLAKQTALAFPDADIEIVEQHHNRKVDAPSGTALMIARALQEVRDQAEIVTGRNGQHKREKKEIGVAALRLGNVVGIHEVLVTTGTQTITLKHEAHSRELFADGAVAAAEYLVKQPAGLYDMNSLVNS